MALNISRLVPRRHFDSSFWDTETDFNGRILTTTLYPPADNNNASRIQTLCPTSDDDDTTTMLYFILSLLLLNIFLHTTGIHLLYQTLNQTKGYVQQLFIINLSLAELGKNILKLIRYIAKLVIELGSVGSLPQTWCYYAGKVRPYAKFAHIWGTYPLYFFIMTYLTVDRLFATVLTLTYKVHITERKAKWLLASTWVVLVSLSLGMVLAWAVDGYYVPDPKPAYIYAVLHVSYALLAIFTYGIMFYKFAQSQRIHAGSRKRNEENGNGFQGTTYKKQYSQYSQAFKESRFFVCILIITSFCFLCVLPGLFFIPMILHGVHMEYPHLKLLVHLLYILSDTVDASIYIFLQRSIRKLLRKKLFCLKQSKDQSFLSRDSKQNDSTSTRGDPAEACEMLMSVKDC